MESTKKTLDNFNNYSIDQNDLSNQNALSKIEGGILGMFDTGLRVSNSTNTNGFDLSYRLFGQDLFIVCIETPTLASF